MVLDTTGQFDPAKTNLYRAESGRHRSMRRTTGTTAGELLPEPGQHPGPVPAANEAALNTDSSPVPTVGEDLFTFMANRLNMSFTNLNCQTFGLTNPVTVVLDGGARPRRPPSIPPADGDQHHRHRIQWRRCRQQRWYRCRGRHHHPASGGLVFFKLPSGLSTWP